MCRSWKFSAGAGVFLAGGEKPGDCTALIWWRIQYYRVFFFSSQKVSCFRVKPFRNVTTFLRLLFAKCQTRTVSVGTVVTAESCGWIEIQLPEEYKQNFDVSSECPSRGCPLARGKWISWRASKRFILLARLGKLPCHKKLGIFKFMFSLSDKFFIVHVLDSNFVFCGPKLDLRQYNIAIYRAVGERVDMLSPLYPLPRYPSGHCLMGSEFYSGQLIFMSNFPWRQVVKKVKLHHCPSSLLTSQRRAFARNVKVLLVFFR